ncbi:MAG: SDR family oxidoreductase [candidate division Zixibacteria bacterium]|nr:SDR family oxidoreductase [candidate division Zixibacteria bacterium]
MDLGLKGRRALVTGASSGLGAAAALALAREGVQLILNSRNEEKLKHSAQKIESETRHCPVLLPADLSSESQLRMLIDKVLRESSKVPVDIVVINGGGPPPGDVRDHANDRWTESYNLVLQPAIRLTRALLDGMVERKWGRLIFITSASVLQPVNELILSNTFRAGVTAFAKTISNNYAKHGITVNCVCPGYTATERLQSLAKSRSEKSGCSVEEELEKFTTLSPAGRIGQPDELASLITYLASERAGFITGTSIPVDGGRNGALI